MTDPRFSQAAKQLLQEFGSNAVIVVSFNRFGYPTVATAESVFASEAVTARLDDIAENILYTAQLPEDR